MLEQDFFEICTFLIKIVGLDFRKNTKMLQFKSFVLVTFLIFQATSSLLLLLHWQGTLTLSALTEALPTLIQTMAKVIAITYHHKKLLKLSKSLKNFWSWDIFGEQLKNELYDVHTFLKKTYLMFATANLGTLLLFILKPILMQIRVLPILRYTWCNMDENSCYFLLYGLQALEFIFVYLVVTGYDALFIGLVAYSYCELEKIKYGFRNYKNCKNAAKTYAELIDHHNLLLDFVHDLSDVSTFVLLCQLGSTVATTCIEILVINFEGYPPDLGRVGNGAAFAVCYLFELGIYCVGGSLIMEQATSVADAIYESNWTNFDYDLRKAALLVIQRSHRPVSLKIGEMLILNLETFASVINFTFSFAALMQRVF